MAITVTLHSGHTFVDGEDLTYDGLNDMFDAGYGEVADDALTTLQELERGNIIVGTESGVGTLNAKQSGRLLVGDGSDLTTLDMHTAGQIPIGDGTNVNAKTLYQDVTLDASGEATVHNQLTIATQWHADDTNFAEKTSVNAEDIILIEDSNDSWKKKKMSVTSIAAAYPRYWKHNLVVANNSVAPTTVMDINVDEIALVDASDRRLLLTGLDLSVTMTGTGVNGLDVGTLAPSSMYYFWIIHKPAVYDEDGVLTSAAVTAGLGSLSNTNPTLPTGYSYKRLVGECYCGAGTTLLYTNRSGDKVEFGEPATDCSVYTSLTALWAAQTLPGAVPSGATRLRLALSCAAGSHLQQTVTCDSAGLYPVDAVSYTVSVTGNYGTTTQCVEMRHNGSGSIYARRFDGGSWADQRCFVLGYELPR